jgi:hypothetical protein
MGTRMIGGVGGQGESGGGGRAEGNGDQRGGLGGGERTKADRNGRKAENSMPFYTFLPLARLAIGRREKALSKVASPPCSPPERLVPR